VVAANRKGAEDKRNQCCNKGGDTVVLADPRLGDVRGDHEHYKSEKRNGQEYLPSFPGE